MVVFDATMMLLAIHPERIKPPINEKTGKPVEYVEARITALISQLEKAKTKIIFPSPALSELLVDSGDDMQAIVENIQKKSVFRIEPFDTLAAIETAIMTHEALGKGDKRAGIKATWAKIKYDRQIVAIAKVHHATAIYSDDSHIRKIAEQENIKVIGIADLPSLTEEQQFKFDFKQEDKTLNEEIRTTRENNPEGTEEEK